MTVLEALEAGRLAVTNGAQDLLAPLPVAVYGDGYYACATILEQAWHELGKPMGNQAAAYNLAIKMARDEENVLAQRFISVTAEKNAREADLYEIRKLASACFIPSWRELIPTRLDALLFPQTQTLTAERASAEAGK